MLVRIIKNCCVPYGGKDHTPETGPFHTTEEIAAHYVSKGIMEAVVLPEPVVDVTEPPKAVNTAATELTLLPSMTVKFQTALQEAGYETIEDIATSEVEDLEELPGIGEKTAARLIEEAQQALED